MAFRDPDEALRAKRAQLLEAIEELRSERDALEQKISTTIEDARLDALLEAREAAKAKSKGRWFLPIGIALVLGLGIVLAASSPSTDSDAEMLFGRVLSVEGEAPVATEAPCTVFIEPLDDSNRFDTRMQVICGDRSVYGGAEAGLMDCRRAEGLVERCTDDDFSDEGGDPKLRFDRERWRLQIADRRPSYEIDIGLTRVEGH